MDRLYGGIGARGDDGAAVRVVFPVPPEFPQPGERKQGFILHMEIIGLFNPVYFFPFIETGGGNQAAALFKCIAEVWFLGQCFRPGINRLVIVSRLGPVRNQAPMTQGQVEVAVIQPDDRDVTGGGNIVAGMEFDGITGGKMLP